MYIVVSKFSSLNIPFSIQDLPGALDDAAISESLNLHKIKSRQWAIFKTSAIKGEGLFEGLDWYLIFNDLIWFLYKMCSGCSS